MVVTDSTKQPRSIRLPVWLIQLLVVLFVIITGAGAYGALTYSKLVSEAALVDDLQSKLQTFRDDKERIHQLERELKSQRLLLRKMAELVGIEPFESLSDSTSVSFASEPNEYMALDAPEEHSWDKPEDSILRAVPNEIPMEGTLSRGFAPDVSKSTRQHFGIDIAAREETPVFATADGRVEFAGWDENFGNYLIIDHLNGYKTHYGHNRSIIVSVDDFIKKGELIALSGNTGRSSAPHLHYEIRYKGEAVNPKDYLDTNELKQAE